MVVSNYDEWVADGSPWHAATPVESLAQVLKNYGYTVYILGDKRHLTANPPEDHTPYSHTPWPGSQPYPAVLAQDIMPGGAWNLDELGAKIFADKQAGHPGLAGLKYMNWTDASGNCWHDKWTPDHQRSSSSDRGHIHLSWRTDYVNTNTPYDPIAKVAQKGYVMDLSLNGLKLPTLHVGNDDSKMSGDHYVGRAQTLLNFVISAGLKVDGVYGPNTAAAVRNLPTNSDGSSLGLAEWKSLYGMIG